MSMSSDEKQPLLAPKTTSIQQRHNGDDNVIAIDEPSPPLTPNRRHSSIMEERKPFDLTKHKKSSSTASQQLAHQEEGGKTKKEKHSADVLDKHMRYKYYSRLAPANKPNMIIMPSHIVPAPIYVITGSKGKQKSIVTILSIWNTMMGTSVLAMPWAIEQAGFATGIACIIIMCAIALYTCQIILRVGNGGRLNGMDVEFADVCRIYLGNHAYVVAVVFCIVTIIGAAMVYWVLMSSFLFTIGDYFHSPHANSTNTSTLLLENVAEFESLGQNSTSSSWENVWTETNVPLFLICILFPLTNFKSITFFTKFNSLGIVSIVYILFFVIYAAANGNAYENSPVGGIHFDHASEFNSSFVALTGILSLAFFIHNGCLSIMRNQENPQHNKRDLNIAFVLVALTYSIVGIVYFLAAKHHNQINNNFLKDFCKEDGNFIFALLAQIFLMIQMITVFPLLLFISRFQVMTTFFKGNAWPGLTHVVTHNVVIVAFCVLIAIFYPQIGAILRYTGALAGVVYVFALPCLVHLVVKKREEGKLSWWDIIGHSLLILVGVANVLGQFLI
eukprot:m.239762 g.239762  ORF g.239762 m.239762 type:complete len:559 (-) comp14025_c0_seq1:909-2585(-)